MLLRTTKNYVFQPFCKVGSSGEHVINGGTGIYDMSSRLSIIGSAR